MNSLSELYRTHHDKVSDKWEIYLSTYDRIFSPYRDKPVQLLEVGVQNGGSLEIWSKYFTQAQKLIGCDINPACAALQYEDPRVAIVVVDANTDEAEHQITSNGQQFDIVIDDGSHRSSDIIKTFARYFPKVVDGGVFVAEDLHCSYWEEFEGGLHDPYSSMSFFKLLVDVVNHEHWGNSQKRGDLISGIAQRYGVTLHEEFLSWIHSVEFVNSMCVIRKQQGSGNQLGVRIVAGQLAQIWNDALKVANHHLVPLDQSSNTWATLERPPGELVKDYKRTIAERDRQIASLNQSIAALHNSTSWRFTKPLRFVGHQLLRVNRLIRVVPSAIRMGGGSIATLNKAVGLYRREGLAGVKRTIRLLQGHGSELARNDYAEWIRRYDTIDDAKRQKLRTLSDKLARKPKISVVMPCYNPKTEWLTEAIESVRGQIYPNWELCIADDASTNPAVRAILEKYVREDGRIKAVYRDRNGHISAASNSALELVTGEWLALLDHDDLLSEHALFWVAEAINRSSDAELIYSDEDKITECGVRHGPYFKCDWNPDLFYSHNMITHLGVYKTSLVRAVQGFRIGFEGSQDYDLALRCIERLRPDQIVHIPRVLYHWRVHAESTAQSAEAKPYAMLAGERAINDHFVRTGVEGRVAFVGHGYHPSYALPKQMPLVSVIIPTRNGLKLIKQCIDSILEKTTYKNYELLIVDNGSDDAATLLYLEAISKLKNVHIIRDDGPFNYSRLNNEAAWRSSGELLALLNNDIEVISPDWLTSMVAHALRPGIGAVGAKLLYPNATVQHGGVILGIGGVAGHAHKHFCRKSYGAFSRLSLTQNISAVTGACLVIKKSIFEVVNGLDEENLGVAFNDVDLCLRLREAGYRNVWTPLAELYHHESASRGYEDTPEKRARFQKEVEFMKHRWGKQLLNDPYYSPNLTLDFEDFSYAWPPRVPSLEDAAQ